MTDVAAQAESPGWGVLTPLSDRVHELGDVKEVALQTLAESFYGDDHDALFAAEAAFVDAYIAFMARLDYEGNLWHRGVLADPPA